MKVELPDTIEIWCGANETTQQVNITEMTPETIINVLARGMKDIAEDTYAGKKAKAMTDDGRADLFTKKLNEIASNEHGFGGFGGGRSLSFDERALREVITRHARTNGFNAADAAKLAVYPAAYFRDLSKAKNKPVSEIEEAFEKAAMPLADAMRNAANTEVSI